MNAKKITVIILCIVFMLAVPVSCGTETDNGAGTPVPSGEEQTTGTENACVFFSSVSNDGERTDRSLTYDGYETVGALLLGNGIIEGENGEYGLFIKTVYGETVGDGAYWAFYIDGEYAMTGVDMTPITDHAQYELRYEKY